MPQQLTLHALLDQAAAAHQGRCAISTASDSITYENLAQASRHAARLLRAHGVQRGDRVVISSPDAIAVAVAVHAASRAGAMFSVLHEDVRDNPLQHVLQDCEPAVIVTDDPGVRATAQAHGVQVLTSQELRHAPAPRKDSPLPYPPLTVDGACLIYTSGTTSLPKAVVSTHQQMLFAAQAIQDCLAYRAADIIYSPLPLSFDYGLYQMFLTFLAGAQLRVGNVAEVGPPLLRALHDSKATVLAAVPSVSDRLAWLVRRAKHKPALRLLTNTGAALSEKTIADLRETMPALRVQLMYGLTECKRATIMPPDGDLQRPGSSGTALPGTEVFTIDDDGKRLPAGEVGQFVVRGPHVMAGYWRRPEMTAERFHRRDGLFPELRTGDYGWMDDEGYLYFSGRRDDLYKERGFRVSATEVEAAARRVKGVDSAAVLPPSPKTGHAAVLAVVTELEGPEILARMQGLIEDYKIPRRCVPVPRLPTNHNGKVDRQALTNLIHDPANA
ncbi:AMP-binding protein [Streptomyces rochei]|uniref:AMP-binding protein n=1 Tax=Streptomyces vinaceusdrappus TaxID=67376 RepID=A0ABY6C788_9ACTN|nr:MULTISPECIES: AMP-binding protein [Streptomyces]NUV96911.1 AMP-binding protein [Streptomyces sp. KAI 90]RSS23537.1 long-chain fatty acid--CoA ligase [Streptomyces sp. WAC08452]UXI82829.1 AMP-binding protein [Streptomyces vinaceusdrappus]